MFAWPGCESWSSTLFKDKERPLITSQTLSSDPLPNKHISTVSMMKSDLYGVGQTNESQGKYLPHYV